MSRNKLTMRVIHSRSLNSNGLLVIFANSVQIEPVHLNTAVHTFLSVSLTAILQLGDGREERTVVISSSHSIRSWMCYLDSWLDFASVKLPGLYPPFLQGESLSSNLTLELTL